MEIDKLKNDIERRKEGLNDNKRKIPEIEN